MSESKMREEFEAAVLRDWPVSNLNRCPSVSSRAGQYADEIIQRAWWGWQASRESLVIELPRFYQHVSNSDYAKGYRQGVRDLVDSIEAVGLKVSQ